MGEDICILYVVDYNLEKHMLMICDGIELVLGIATKIWKILIFKGFKTRVIRMSFV